MIKSKELKEIIDMISELEDETAITETEFTWTNSIDKDIELTKKLSDAYYKISQLYSELNEMYENIQVLNEWTKEDYDYYEVVETVGETERVIYRTQYCEVAFDYVTNEVLPSTESKTIKIVGRNFDD